jgi:hypothetical protein
MNVSRHDSLHELVTTLKPLADEAKRAGNERAFYMWRLLEAEDSLHGDFGKAVGTDRVTTARMFFDALKSPDELLRSDVKAKAADAMALLQSGKGSQNVAQRLQSIEVLRGLLNPKN